MLLEETPRTVSSAWRSSTCTCEKTSDTIITCCPLIYNCVVWHNFQETPRTASSAWRCNTCTSASTAAPPAPCTTSSGSPDPTAWSVSSTSCTASASLIGRSLGGTACTVVSAELRATCVSLLSAWQAPCGAQRCHSCGFAGIRKCSPKPKRQHMMQQFNPQGDLLRNLQ